MKFNINDTVKIKLTPRGLEILKDYHAEYIRTIPNWPKEFSPPKTDENGYSEWQMWQVMEDFGPYIRMGAFLPFETEIIIPTVKGE